MVVSVIYVKVNEKSVAKNIKEKKRTKYRSDVRNITKYSLQLDSVPNNLSKEITKKKMLQNVSDM